MITPKEQRTRDGALTDVQAKLLAAIPRAPQTRATAQIIDAAVGPDWQTRAPYIRALRWLRQCGLIRGGASDIWERTDLGDQIARRLAPPADPGVP